jgi:sugar-phosphatase
MKAVLFDVDGVLLDSIASYRRVWSAWCAVHGLELRDVWLATHGRRPEETIREVAPRLDAVTEVERLRTLLLDDTGAVPAYAGAASLLRALPRRHWGVVTSGHRGVVLDRFDAAGLPEPGVLVTGEDVTHGKPDPHCYQLAARVLGRAAGDCLVVEDAPAGVAAGRAAGMRTLGVETTHPGAELNADETAPDLATAAPRILEWVTG